MREGLDLPAALAVLGLLLWIVLQYGLIVLALRDLRRRPVVRGGNKVAWALLVLIVPVAGPLLYAALHPGMRPSLPPRRRPRRPFAGLRRPRGSASAASGICPPEATPRDAAEPATPTAAGPARPLDRSPHPR